MKNKLQAIYSWFIIIVFYCKLRPIEIAESIFNMNGILLKIYLNEDYTHTVTRGVIEEIALSELIKKIRLSYFVFALLILTFNSILISILYNNSSLLLNIFAYSTVNLLIVLIMYMVYNSIIYNALNLAKGEKK